MKCEECKWWERLLEKGDVDEGESTCGYCHRNAPIPQLVEDSTEPSPEVVFPLTEGFYWCGEFIPKAPAALERSIK